MVIKNQLNAVWDVFAHSVESVGTQLITGLQGSAKALFLAQQVREHAQPLLYVAPNLLQATQIVEDLQWLLPADQVYLFPTEESVAAEFAIASLDLMAQRVEALCFLSEQRAGIVVTSLSGMQRHIAPPEVFRQHRLTFEVGASYDLATVVRQLVSMGYERAAMVGRPGEFSVRGGIVDVYPLTVEQPIRLDFFDDVLDALRVFDEDSQRSSNNLERVTIEPCTDCLFTQEQLQQRAAAIGPWMSKQIAKVADSEVRAQLTNFFATVQTAWANGSHLHDRALYLSLIYAKPHTVFDYLPPSGKVILDDYARINEAKKQDDALVAEWQLEQVQAGHLLPEQMLFVDWKETLKKSPHQTIYLATLQKGLGRIKFDAVSHVSSRSLPQFFSQMPVIKTECERWLKQKMTVVVLCAQQERADKVAQTFDDFGLRTMLADVQGLRASLINVVVGRLHSGFELPEHKLVVLTERELFNKVHKVVPRRQNLSNAERLKSYSELVVGDYVVHVNHGIGQYRGIETMDIGGIKQDYLSIVYQDDAQLFIPVHQIQLVQKYVASDGKAPRINKLGGSEWSKTKRKVAAKIEDIADELIDLYAKREAAIGYAYPPDTPEQQAFEASFAYSETADQLRSSQEIKRDMQRPQPMDRLLVGDVGYGKTEVAMRAIFKAVQEGKQVAFLVPTTILAQQHYTTLVQRFEEYPVVIGLLSRFRSAQEQRQTIEQLARGQVDIVIGTHRLLSQDVRFLDLGLLVIDEEQRFGVRHKERLKQLRTEVDVLTLTATPIPRTLHLSMLGVRDLSVIETPPANRYPVQTYVVEQRYDVVRDAMERELARGGQAFYLYNRVEFIERKAEKLRELLPHATIGVAHGQMSEVALEQVLLDFLDGVYDVLVTTTIIETGVDMPNVNTLFVEDADRMGLSQLYQLRGRVGRTNRLAYAYFMFRPEKVLSEASEKRLTAIKEFSQLGAGFKIAMRDLSIRGAGNMLGQQQHGFIDSVGFDLYSEMLQEAVARRRGATPEKPTPPVEIDLAITAYFPNHYIADERQKIELYKRVRRIEGAVDYRELQDDLIDRFGEFPDEVAHLLMVGLLKCYAEQQHVVKIMRHNQQVVLTYAPEQSASLSGAVLLEQLSHTQLPTTVQTSGQSLRVVCDISGRTIDSWLTQLIRFAAASRQVTQQEERDGTY